MLVLVRVNVLVRVLVRDHARARACLCVRARTCECLRIDARVRRSCVCGLVVGSVPCFGNASVRVYFFGRKDDTPKL